jgi:hypothetical protein
VQTLAMMQRDLQIPAGKADFKTEVALVTPVDLEVLGVTPHMHFLGKSMRVWATLPDASEVKLIRIDDWDFNWQGQYQFKQRVKLPKGTVIHLAAEFDNSAENPNNPNEPPKDVKWGEQTTDEMCLAFLQYATANPDDRKTLFIAMVKQFQLWKFAGEFKRD